MLMSPTVTERAHLLGRFNRFKGARPIIVAFTFYKDTEDILSLARSLEETSYSINRDYLTERHPRYSTPEKEEWKGCCSVGSRKGRGIQWSVYGCVQ